jgi:hypothetical protein
MTDMNAFGYAEPAGKASHLRAHLRTYLAGVGATAALTAGALVAFLSLATFLAFSGFPSAGPSSDAGAAYLGSSGTAAARSAAAALGVGHAAVTKGALTGARGGGPGSSGGANGGGGPGGGAETIGGAPIAPPPSAPPASSASIGPAESAVSYADQATSQLGVSVPPGPAGTVDTAARRRLNSASPGLGNQLSRTGSSLVHGLPGP